MIIGVPKEIKEDEYRVGIVPAGVKDLVRAGHQVFIEEGAGVGSGISNEEYERAGAELLPSSLEVFQRAEMIMKVKEPLEREYELFREGQILYTFLHLAPAPKLAEALLARRIIGIAYETVQLSDGSLPLLTPMSEVAGRMSLQEGAKYLEREVGGRGILLSGVPGVEPGCVVILGAGIVGSNATKVAVGLGTRVTILDINMDKLRYLDDIYRGRIVTLMSNMENIANELSRADLVIGAVLLPGAMTPRLITREMISNMKEGAVIVDVSIDQGGCAETSRPTSHSDPIYKVDGVTHYCVTNIPGAVGRTSSFALTNVTMPYALQIADKGVRRAIKDDAAIARGVNLYMGEVTHPAVAETLGRPCRPIEKLVG